ncbi:MAG: ComEC/Rec2 family competence protein [Candidatus Didemnitutus sp.]|nr:ComEC/Rec2 family competence protein [Candidatus Didemnitutus sp.]
MSSPGSLRAPLLWLLLPFMAGLTLAELHRPVPLDVRWGAGVAGGMAVVAWLFRQRGARGAQFAWSATLIGTAGLAGYLWLPLRSPPGLTWDAAPREVNVVLEIEQIYAPAPQRKTFSGLARIVSAEGPASGLAGQRVYFAAIRRISTVPDVSGHYRYRGLVEPVPPAVGSSRGFDRYLESLGVRLRLMRGQLHEQQRPPQRFRHFCARVRERLDGILEQGLDRYPQISSLYQAMLLGEKAVLSSEQQSAFMRSGVFHIFSISGLHVGVIATAILSGLTLLRVPRREASIAGLVVLWLYVQVTGASTPAERAFLMIAFLVSSRVFRLPGNSLAALAAAAFTTLLLEPRQLFMAGFQMSYSVVTALVVMGGPLADRWRSAWKPWRELPESHWGWWRHATRWGGDGFLAAAAITWAAVIASTPGSIGNFGLFSPGALLGNLVIVPLASLAIIGGFISLLCGLVGLLPLSILFNHASAVVILTMDALVKWTTAVPGVYFPATFDRAWMGPAAQVAVLGTMLLVASRRVPHGHWLAVVVLALTMILGVKFG